MSNLNAQGRLLGNMQATTTELLEQTLKERGRGSARRLQGLEKDVPFPLGVRRAT